MTMPAGSCAVRGIPGHYAEAGTMPNPRCIGPGPPRRFLVESRLLFGGPGR
jgi:hypothetical protein